MYIPPPPAGGQAGEPVRPNWALLVPTAAIPVQLGSATEVTQLIPGDPEQVRTLARALTGFAEKMESAWSACRQITLGGWVGAAANAMAGQLTLLLQRLAAAKGAFAAAGERLNLRVRLQVHPGVDLDALGEAVQSRITRFTTTTDLEPQTLAVVLAIDGRSPARVQGERTTARAPFRLLTTRAVSTNDVLPGVVVAALGWQILQSIGTYLLHTLLADLGDPYGLFGLLLGLIAWIYLGAVLMVIAVEISAVRVDRLWPRALLTPFTDDVDLTRGDQRAYTAYTETERYKGYQDITVEFARLQPEPADPIPDTEGGDPMAGDMSVDLAAIRARLEDSSPGPWARHGPDVHAPGQGPILRGRDGSAEIRAQADRDAEFVAHARADIAALLDLVATEDEQRPAATEPP